MNSYFMEILMKQRQQELEEEFKRIHLSRAVRNPGMGFLKLILRFGEFLIVMGARLKKRYRPSIKTASSAHDSCSKQR